MRRPKEISEDLIDIDRERELVMLIRVEKSYKTISKELGLHQSTVKHVEDVVEDHVYP